MDKGNKIELSSKKINPSPKLKFGDRVKVCYILPKFDLETDTHFFYIYHLINEASQELDMSLIIEESNSDLSFFKNIKNIYVQRFRSFPLRFLENLVLVFKNRIKGYNNFYVHYSYIGAFNAGLVSRLSKAKAFYWNCGMMWLFGKDRFLQIVLKTINYLVTGVEALRKGYAENYNISLEKIKIMPNWVDLERFQDIQTNYIYEKYNLKQGQKYILFLHRLAKRKGAHYIVPVANLLKDLDVEFIVAGDGPYEDTLKQEIEEKGLNNIRLIGRVPNKEVPALMKISQIYFMPSEEEGFPRVLLESMASGLPYVGSDIGGVKEISSSAQQKFIFPIGDIKVISQGIRELLLNSTEYTSVIEKNRKHVKQFDIRVITEKFINLFK